MRWGVLLVLVIATGVARGAPRTEPPTESAVVIVVDPALSADKLIAIEAGLLAAIGESEEIQLAVVAAGTKPSIALPMTHVTAANRMQITKQLPSVHATRRSNILGGLRTAAAQLAAVQVERKHVLVITDGDPDVVFAPTLTKIRAADITVSVLGYQSVNDVVLRDLAHRGYGELYRADNHNDLVSSFIDRFVSTRSVALVLVLDRSGSMQGVKLENMKEAARALAEMLAADDKIAVVTFDTAATTHVPLTRASNRVRIANDIARISAAGETDIGPALDEAGTILAAVTGAVKHVVVLSDGESPPADLAKRIDKLRAARITISAVGPTKADRETLSLIADHGDGRLYLLDDIARLPTMFSRRH